MQNAATAGFISSLGSWVIPPWATLGLVLTAIVYFRGWRAIRRTRAEQFPLWRLFSMMGGLFTIWIAIASPIDTLSNLLLVVHMTQHLLLMSVAPPLVVLSAPIVPLLRGLPRSWIREGLGPFFTLAPVHALERLLKSRIFAWLAMNLAFLAWHVPAAYDLALQHPQLHEVEHACFFLTSVLFWWPIIEPWPTVYKGSRWLMLPYLMSADIVNTALSAFLSFSGRVVYPAYENAPRLFGISALSDQVAAGSLMWVLGSMAYLVPIMWVTLRMLSRRPERRAAARAFAAAHGSGGTSTRAWNRIPKHQGAGATVITQTEAVTHTQTGARSYAGTHTGTSHSGRREGPALAFSSQQPGGGARSGFDLFTLPGVGSFFKSRYGRQMLQAILLLVSAAVIVDGFFGHRMSSMNLAGIIPWTYARAVFVLALLLVGNLFCMSCPFTLPRELAKRAAAALGFARLPWPRALRGKWLSVALLGVFFWAYEAFAIWDSPARTASLLVAYFLTAIAVDSVFRGASFCKYVCPLGQFNFVSSLLSPVGLAARSQAACSNCSTRNCIAGTEAPNGRQLQRGCELDLFMPLKSGNLDCTLCMDCVKACPHDNIGLFVQPPALELVQIMARDPQRSSVGRYSRRAHLATLAILVVAAAFASAAVMVAPVASALARASAVLPGWLAPTAGILLAAAAPAILTGLLAMAVLSMQRRFTRAYPPAAIAAIRGSDDISLRAQLCRWALALLPLGLGMWAAHLSFHLVTGWNSLTPALSQAARDLHLARVAPPNWAAEHSLLKSNALLQLQLALLDAGLLFALYLGWRMVRSAARDGNTPPTIGGRVITLAPWATVVMLLYAAGVWVLLEPMQMRGMVGM